MKVVLLTGSHPRHLYLAKKLLEANVLTALLIETREHFVPVPPQGLSELDRQNFIRHFIDREEAERRFFGEITTEEFASLPLHEVSRKQLNSNETRDWVVQFKPDLVLTYGVHKLDDSLLEHFPDYAWNIHGGLSPWYRGNITLFWPFYFLKPNWAGMTIHRLTSRLDGGAIVHHSRPELHRGDGIHDVACRAVVQVAHDLIKILDKLKSGAVIEAQEQRSSGKLFVASDWKPQHLRLIYNTFNNDIVDRYLDGELGVDEPPLITCI